MLVTFKTFAMSSLNCGRWIALAVAELEAHRTAMRFAFRNHAASAAASANPDTVIAGFRSGSNR
jgi:hypothetical protein